MQDANSRLGRDRCVNVAHSCLKHGSMCASFTQFLGARVDVCKMHTVAWSRDRYVQDANSRLGRGRCVQDAHSGLELGSASLTLEEPFGPNFNCIQKL